MPYDSIHVRLHFFFLLFPYSLVFYTFIAKSKIKKSPKVLKLGNRGKSPSGIVHVSNRLTPSPEVMWTQGSRRKWKHAGSAWDLRHGQHHHSCPPLGARRVREPVPGESSWHSARHRALFPCLEGTAPQRLTSQRRDRGEGTRPSSSRPPNGAGALMSQGAIPILLVRGLLWSECECSSKSEGGLSNHALSSTSMLPLKLRIKIYT